MVYSNDFTILIYDSFHFICNFNDCIFKYDPVGVTKNYQGLSVFLTLLGGTIIVLLGFLSAQNEPFFRWSDLSFQRPIGPLRPGAHQYHVQYLFPHLVL